MVLVDFPVHQGYAHLVASNINELHEFAQSIGLKKSWYENKKGKKHPHYDINARQVDLAINAGAKQVSSKQIVDFLNENYGQ